MQLNWSGFLNSRGKRSLLVGEVVNGGVLWKNIKTGKETFEQYDCEKVKHESICSQDIRRVH